VAGAQDRTLRSRFTLTRTSQATTGAQATGAAQAAGAQVAGAQDFTRIPALATLLTPNTKALTNNTNANFFISNSLG